MTSFYEHHVKNDHEVYAPTDFARSGWGSMVRGPAITSLLARAIRLAVVDDALIPSRTTFDLHSPVPLSNITTQSRVLRDGRRLKVVEAELIADDKIVARARSLWLRQNSEATVEDNVPWAPHRIIECPPDPPRALTSDGRLFWSESVGWTDDGRDHKNSDRKGVWQTPLSVVHGEPTSKFEIAAAAADMSNMVTGSSHDGLDFINADATLSLTRLPAGEGIGVVSVGRTVHDGIAVGSTAFFDRAGDFGAGSVTTRVQPNHRMRFIDDPAAMVAPSNAHH